MNSVYEQDIANILSRLNTLPTDHGFPANSKLFIYQEVIDQNDGVVTVDQYYNTGKTNNLVATSWIKQLAFYSSGHVTEFRYCNRIALGIQNYTNLNDLVDFSLNMSRSDRAFIFVDNHDNQRGQWSTGNIIRTIIFQKRNLTCSFMKILGAVLTHKTPRDYKQAVAYTLAQDYGFTRIMSSYSFDTTDQGPPSVGYK